MEDQRNHAADRYSEQRELVEAVIDKWAEVTGLPPVSALSLDDEGDAEKQPVLSPGSLPHLFKIDCELITERILKDDAALQSAWFAIARGESVSAMDKRKLVKKLAGPYQRIRPNNYFRTRRVGSAESIQRAKQCAA
jgi:hypothetical protein